MGLESGKPERKGLKLPEGVKLMRGNREKALEKFPGPHLDFEGDEGVLENLFQKEEGTINVVIYLGGGDRPQGGAASLAFQEKGRLSAIDYICASSTGVATASHALTGQAEKNKRMYRMLTADGPFKELKTVEVRLPGTNLKKSFGPMPSAVHGKTIRDVAEGRLGSIKVERDKESESTEFIVAVTDRKTGVLEFLDGKKHQEPWDVRFASANAPTPNQKQGVLVDGRMKTDGSIANPFPIREMIQEVRNRIEASGRNSPYKLSVTVIMNTKEAVAKYGESNVMKGYMAATHPWPTAKKVFQNQAIFNGELAWARKQIQDHKEGKTDDEILLVWSRHHPEMLMIDQAESKVLFEGAQTDMEEMLNKAEKRVKARESHTTL